MGYRKRKKEDDTREDETDSVGKLWALGLEFCELSGASSIGMIGAQGILQILRC